MHCARVVAATVLLVGLVQSYSWDFVVGTGKYLDFYYENGSYIRWTHREVLPSVHWMTSLTHDPLHSRLLFTANRGESAAIIYSFDLVTKKIQHLVSTKNYLYVRVVYEPVTETIYWKEGTSILSYSLNAASSNQEGGNHVVELKNECEELAVDSCGGYIYWVTYRSIGRTRLDGSETQVLINGTDNYREGLVLDQLTQKIYWIERTRAANDIAGIVSANFDGKNKTTLDVLYNVMYVHKLELTKDFIYYKNFVNQGVWRVYKHSRSFERKLLTHNDTDCWFNCFVLATNYPIHEQIQGIESCGALQALMRNDSKSERAASVCRNYCFQGECSVSAEGHPTCSCKAGYSGERCEVNACLDYCLHGGVCSLDEHHQRVCQCAAGYEGERCDLTICNKYCLRGDCSVGADGRPMCSCPAGYSGERCEVKICKDYCFKGNCSVGADGQPFCSCEPGYSGVRCEVNTCCREYCLAGGFCVLNEEDMPPAYQDKPGSDGGRCEEPTNKDHSSDEGTASACRQFCLNDGVCSLSEAGAPVCRCTADYAGERCDVPAFLVKWVYTHVPPVTVGEVKSTSAATVVSTTELVRNERDT